MKTVEFGTHNETIILLLHAGGLSWWNYKDVADILQKKYHVVIPILDGHADSDRNFISIQENAASLCQYIQERFGGSVFAIGGLSLGGQILIEMLSQSPDICKCALIESALVIPMPFTNSLVGPMCKMSYSLIKKRWFAKLEFKALGIKEELFPVYYEDTCKITKENMIAFLKSNSCYTLKSSLANTSAKVIIAVGAKEKKKMKNSAILLHKKISGSELLVFPNYRHGDLSINHAGIYTALLENQRLRSIPVYGSV